MLITIKIRSIEKELKKCFIQILVERSAVL